MKQKISKENKNKESKQPNYQPKEEKLRQIIELLTELKEDNNTPKNIKLKISEIIDILNSDIEKSLKIDKIMHIFEQFNEDSNIDSYTRTQLWHIASSLESL